MVGILVTVGSEAVFVRVAGEHSLGCCESVIMTGLGCVNAKCTHMRLISSVRSHGLKQPIAIPFRLILGNECTGSFSRFTGPFPLGWKMKCQSATECPYLEGT